MEIIAVVNQKGGVGKTTTCMNLAASLAAINKKVLILDLDSQGNASTGVGVEHSRREKNLYGCFIGQYSLDEVICDTAIKNLFICPSTIDIAAAELNLKDRVSREFILKNKILELSQNFDYVIIDCPPSLNLLTVNALAASDEVIIPVQCEFFALEGLSHLLKTIRMIQKRINPTLSIRGILITMFDRRNKIAIQVAREIKKHLGSKLFDTVIPRNVKISEAPSFGKPAIVYDYNCKGAQAYIRLVKEILAQNKKLRVA